MHSNVSTKLYGGATILFSNKNWQLSLENFSSVIYPLSNWTALCQIQLFLARQKYILTQKKQ